MREILFRGKNKYCSSWIVGYYYEKNGNPRIKNDYQDLEVDPNTIGQYTGLKDKNGTKIFEGDIVRDKDNPQLKGFNDYIIYFEDGSFMRQSIEWSDIGGFIFSEYNAQDVEVVGNIYDNPELLEKGEIG